MCSIKKATKLASSSLLQETEAESYTFNPIGQGRELHIGVAHMSHHQLFRLAYGINLIQLHYRGRQGGLTPCAPAYYFWRMRLKGVHVR